ncbi:hypothetical protein LCGC14_2294020, partial [marine sediment metagenome]
GFGRAGWQQRDRALYALAAEVAKVSVKPSPAPQP